jgi:hypothetical protein
VNATGNRVTGAGANGFDVLGLDGLYFGNTAKGSAGFDLFDPSGSGNTYADNHFGTTNQP